MTTDYKMRIPEYGRGDRIDHWIVEHWDAGARRWVRTDPQLDDRQREALGATFDADDLPGIVGHQPDARKPEVDQDLRADAVLPEVRLEA